MKHVAFFGDGEKTFALTSPMILELQRKTGHGILAIYTRLRTHQASFAEITETLRCALVGGGTDPREANELVWTYADNRPIAESLAIALEVLALRFFGPEDNGQDETSDAQKAAATGDLAAAVSEADHG